VVTPDPVTLDAVGATQPFSAEARDANDNPLAPQPASFDWASTDEAVATVAPAAGATTTATAESNGTTQIQATTGGVTGNAQLTVDQAITEVVVTPDPVTLDAIGAIQAFSAEARDGSGNPVVPQPSFAWASSDEGVATVSPAAGATTTATAVSNGTTQIQATASGITGSAALTVDQAVSSIVLTPAAATLNAFDATQVFSAEARDANDNPLGTQPSFNWLSTETGFATVAPATGATTTATAVADGVTEIQATVTGVPGVTGTADLTVAQTTSSVVVTPDPVTMDAFGLTQQFAAEARDANDNPMTTQPTFTWGGGGSVATVSATGLATAVANGTTQVTATGDGVPGSADLTVAQVATTVEVTPASATVPAAGETQQFTAVAKDANDSTLTSQPAFTWSSDDLLVVTIDPSSGLATAQGDGSATITATGGGASGTAEFNVQAVTIVFTPTVDTLDAIMHEVWYTAEAHDAGGPISPQPTFAWSEASGGSIATITATDTNATGAGIARVMALANGTTYLRATASGVTDSAEVTVQQAIGQISVTPASVNLSVSGTQTFSAQAYDRNGTLLATQPTTYDWATTDGAIVTVNPAAGLTTLGTAVADGWAGVTATSGGITGSATVRVGSLTAVYWLGTDPDARHWHNAANWSSGTIPGASDDVVIDVPGIYRITVENGETTFAKSITIGAATGQQTLELFENIFVTETLTIRPNGRLATMFAEVNGTLNNQGQWDVFEGSVLSGTGVAHVNSDTIDVSFGDLTINLDNSTFSTQDAFLATGAFVNVVQTGASSFTVEGSHGKITIPSGRTFTVDGGTFNLAALIDTLPRIDGRFGTGTLALTNGAIGNFAQTVQTSNVIINLNNATYSGLALTSDNMDYRTTMTNSTVNTVVSNSETIDIYGTTTFTGTSFTTNNGHIYGIGTLDVTGATTFTNAGRIDPAGHFATDPNPDTLTVAGNLTQAATSEIMIHIKQLAPDTVITDVLVVTGVATLDGALMAELHATDTGYIPSSGDEFQVMTAASGSGTFDNDTVTVGGVVMEIEYRSGNTVWLVVP
jgi:hypothetical protein